MKRIKKFGIINSDDDYEEKVIRLCEHCLSYGLKNKLGPRLYRHDEPIPTDWEEFLQCPKCGNIFGKYEVKTEASIEDFAQITDNPFDEGKTVVGLNNITRGRTKTTDLHKRIKRMKQEIDKEKDQDIKKELRKGNTVTIVEDTYYDGITK